MQKTRVGMLIVVGLSIVALLRGISLLTRKAELERKTEKKGNQEETARKRNSVVHNAATRKRNTEIADWLLVLADVEAWHTVAEGVIRQEASMHRGNTITKGSNTSWE
eukprot:g25745.t1